MLLGFGLTASPAMALSLNPEAASPGITDANTLHTIVFVVILAVIVLVNLGILFAARPRTRHEKPSTGQRPVPGTVAIGSGIFSIILFFGAVATGSLAVILVVLAIVVALNLALLKASGPRSGKRGKVSQASLAAGLGALAVTLFVIAAIFSDRSREVPVSTETVAGQVEGEPLEIRATAQQWLWRFDYPDGAFSYRRLVVPTGATVRLKLVSTDVIHGWNVPELTGKAQAVPGRSNYVHFRADEPGTYLNRSSVFSGQGYDTMEIEVEVLEPAEYEAAIAALKQDSQDAQDQVETEFQATQQKAAEQPSAEDDASTDSNTDQTESADSE